MAKRTKAEYTNIFTDDRTLELFAAEVVREWATNQNESVGRDNFNEWLESFTHSLTVAADDLFRTFDQIGGKQA